MKHTATYSPEDDKVRIYPACRLEREDYLKIKSAGFSWAPKQELFFAVWSPKREDLALEFCGEIGDEDKSLVERAEERADRFGGYSENRERDAEQAQKAVHAISDNIPFGQPILVGHHSEERARRDAEKIENGMRKSVKMWETAEYWQSRAAGALRHAKYKERPDVRARRIKGLEADKRRCIAQYTPRKPEMRIMQSPWHCPVCGKYSCKEHPEAETKIEHVFCGQGRGGCWVAVDSIPRIKKSYERVITHIENRLVYEKAMLSDSGGMETDKTRPEVGGACQCWASPGRFSGDGGWSYIRKVNRVSVTVEDNWGNGGKNFTRNIPFDKLIAVMSKKDVDTAMAAGKITGDSTGKGFFLAVNSQPPVATPAAQAEATETTPEPEAAPESHAEALESKSEIQPETTENQENGRVAKGFSPAPSSNQAEPEPEPEPEPEQMDLFASTPEGPEEKPIPVPTMVVETSADAGKRGREDFEAMKQTLKMGIQTVSAPQLFPTPPELAERMVELAEIKPGQSVLEPSAGLGNIVKALVEEGGCGITAVEINSNLCGILKSKFEHVKVINQDFLSCNGDLGRFDRVVMNPPFENADDVKHIQHAATLLKTGGRLVAICAGGHRQEAALLPMSSSWERLPAGTFKQSGTNVQTVLLTIQK